jgi:hypothetical protein
MATEKTSATAIGLCLATIIRLLAFRTVFAFFAFALVASKQAANAATVVGFATTFSPKEGVCIILERNNANGNSSHCYNQLSHFTKGHQSSPPKLGLSEFKTTGCNCPTS